MFCACLVMDLVLGAVLKQPEPIQEPPAYESCEYAGEHRVSVYMYALESEAYTHDDYGMVNKWTTITVGGERVTLPYRAVWGVEGAIMQGTVLLRDGRAIHVQHFDGHWERIGNSKTLDYFVDHGGTTWGWGKGKNLVSGRHVAADLSIYPIGTHLYVEGHGMRVVADTGGAIVGAKLDAFGGTGFGELFDYSAQHMDGQLGHYADVWVCGAVTDGRYAVSD